MDNKIHNNVNFTARLDISKLKLDKDHWGRIAEEFKLKTPDYPDDVFVLKNDEDSLTIVNTNPEFGTKPWFMILGEGFERLLKLADSEVVDKFRKLLFISKKGGEVQKESEKTLNSLLSYLDDAAEGDYSKGKKVLNNSYDAQIKELELNKIINELADDDVLAYTMIRAY